MWEKGHGKKPQRGEGNVSVMLNTHAGEEGTAEVAVDRRERAACSHHVGLTSYTS